MKKKNFSNENDVNLNKDLFEKIGDEGETKYYNLLDKPVEITVSNNTYTANANVVINRKPTKLPNTGTIGAIAIVISGFSLIALAIIIFNFCIYIFG